MISSSRWELDPHEHDENGHITRVFLSMAYIHSTLKTSMEVQTEFGTITFPDGFTPAKRHAILRALKWCDDIIKMNGRWEKGNKTLSLGTEVHQDINGRKASIYPLAAAKLDTGKEVAGFTPHHVPVYVDGNRICVAAKFKRAKPLHTDLAASLIAFLGQPEPDHSELPRTLGRALFPEKYARTRHRRMMPWHENAQRRREVCEAFDAVFHSAEFAPGQHVANLPPEDWRLLRGNFPWYEGPDSAIEVARWIMDQHERPVTDHLWTLDMFREHAPDEHQQTVLPAYLRFHDAELRGAALAEYRPDDPQTAWEHLEPSLEDEMTSLSIRAFETLQTYEQLEAQLVTRCLDLLEEGVEVDIQIAMVPWLSHRMDMDNVVQYMLPDLQPFQLSNFLRNVKTNGSWLHSFAETWRDSPFEGVRMGMVECTAKNPSINPFDLWLPLMQHSTGSMKVSILSNLRCVTDEQAHVLLELGWKSQWRFVVRKAHRVVEQQFPDYPHREAMLAHGLGSVTTSRASGVV